jgi:hypothetical protein
MLCYIQLDAAPTVGYSPSYSGHVRGCFQGGMGDRCDKTREIQLLTERRSDS